MEATVERPARVPEGIWESLGTEGRALVVVLCSEVQQLQAEIEKLRDQGKQNSSNSSLPPSSDRPWDKPKRKKKARGGKRGGQKGHPPHVRELLPPDKVQEVKDHYPLACEGCGHVFEGGEAAGGEAQVHQVAECPQIAPHVTEHRIHSVTCPRCNRATRAKHPIGVPKGNFGPRLMALVAVLTVAYHLSKRQVKGLLGTVLGVEIGLGTLPSVQKTATAALEQPVKEVQEALKECPVVYQDETRWPIGGKGGYGWVSVGGPYGFYHIAPSRSGEVARGLLGGADFKGNVVTDRYAAYRCYPMERRGICHSHLERDGQKIAERSDDVKHIGEGLVKLEKDIFSCWHRYKNGEIDRSALKQCLHDIAGPYDALLIEGIRCDDPKVAGMCWNIKTHWRAIWNFGWVEGMEPTNNQAEQAARLLVVLRKKSYGTQSLAGATFVGHMATVIETCRRQARNVLAFVTDAMTAFIGGTPHPSLVVPHTGQTNST